MPQPAVRPAAPRPAARRRQYRIPQVPDSAWTAAPSRRRTWIGRGLLLGILLVQAVLSLRLRNTAFEDEALYLYAGHLNLDHLLHHGPAHTEFVQYFSGSPMLYPTVAAAVDSAFGLAGTRLLGFACMIGCTGLLYAMSRRLFNERVALAAAGAFAVAQSTLFLSNFATHDPPALFLLAMAAWLVVRCAAGRGWAIYVFAPPLLALAVAVKYAALIYVPVIVLLGSLVTIRRSVAVARLFLIPGLTAMLLAGAIEWGGREHLTALSSTTTERAAGGDPPLLILAHAIAWGGALVMLSLFGAIMYIARPRMGEIPTTHESAPGPFRRLLLSTLLTGTALLAPAYQMHLHTEVSLHKHIGYGLFFAAPMAGIGLTRIVGAHFRNPQLGILIWVTLLILGMSQSQTRYAAWPNSTPMVAALKTQITRDGRYLAENKWVALYYLRTQTKPEQWSSTHEFTYTDRKQRRRTGQSAYQAAIATGYFDLVELDGTTTPQLTHTLTEQLRASPRYRLLAKLPYHTTYGEGTFDVWVKNPDLDTPTTTNDSRRAPKPRS